MRDKLKTLYEKLPKSYRLWLVCYGTLGVLLVGSIFFKTEAPSTDAPRLESADTYIPDGYVLVPISLQNQESLDSLLGSFGVVDLYSSSTNTGQKARKLANQVKIIRAPLNPNQFAVLVPEKDSAELVKFAGPVTATLQNPKKANPRFFRNKKGANRIIFENYGG